VRNSHNSKHPTRSKSLLCITNTPASGRRPYLKEVRAIIWACTYECDGGFWRERISVAEEGNKGGFSVHWTLGGASSSVAIRTTGWFLGMVLFVIVVIIVVVVVVNEFWGRLSF